ncbi:MFS transporter [Rhizobium leguminosarum]|uniref:Transmembrane transporter protein n=2 Tax=Rhizobium TaxID=379 RepID=Q1MMJ8_RHIJ3|nr:MULTISPECIES: MFS transporter [Rhizobium]MBY5320631.1 MFS transporter [Rhizobium leguminosarum]MBY5377068.1 MFS transporter [Rhizobium leguminosarum]MBY5379884.1 MFS transporter [Rhizobium leguminosarum]MBY5423891.1 MFS transporter [Rhizobium leguminosarum]MCA2431818.1 MFS transporter [Rhizobium leguminosarum]
MFGKAYEAQCQATKFAPSSAHHESQALALFSLALGSFCIGTSEFASMGIIQLYAEDFGIDIPTATNAITGYAFGVVLGAPLATLVAARLNRRTLLLCLMALWVVGNVLSSMASNIGLFAAARFISGVPQGAYFGAGAVIAAYFFGADRAGKAFALVMTGLTIATIFGSPLATFLGQTLGWRNTYLAMAALGAVAFLALFLFVPRTEALNGGSVLHELSGLRRWNVWAMIVVAALGISSIFAVYAFIGPLVTDVVQLDQSTIPLALGVFGVGMTVGNAVGGQLADIFAFRGLILGYGITLILLVILSCFGTKVWVFMPCLFGLGAAMMAAIPTIQVRMTHFAPEAPTLMGAMNLAALNVANALGAWGGGLVIAAGYSVLFSPLAGFVLTAAGLLVYFIALPRSASVVQA